MCVEISSMLKPETISEANREVAISHITSVLGMPRTDVTNDLKLGPRAHYLASLIRFGTGVNIEITDMGAASVDDILTQL